MRPASSEPRINRRALLIGGGVVAAGAIGAVILSGVGGGDDSTDAAAPSEGGDVGGGLGQGATELNILNWTEYIDLTGDGEIGTVDRFQDESGVAVNYSETFNDNNEVYGKEFAAYLDAGNPTPWDIAVPTYWMAARLKSNDWLAPLPFNLIPNYVNLEPQYLNLAWDRGAKYHLPWQAGITGFAYNAGGDRSRAEEHQRPVRSRVRWSDRHCSPRCATRSASSCSARATTRRRPPRTR